MKAVQDAHWLRVAIAADISRVVRKGVDSETSHVSLTLTVVFAIVSKVAMGWGN